ncbi:MAG: 6,7-dimethyl-8-ribityllumazine synthase [Aestuariivita sp.]|nr:6,7-dimethyl-8-ribityllumazine synthase [Aestuariivita sp.]MCY4203667.1 6,7-dimethyl-8-ribityllumazine synthase [Aestuariivita sp.]
MNNAESSLAVSRPKFETKPTVLIVTAVFYREIAGSLLRGATAELDACGANCDTVEVAGAMEVPTAIALAENEGRFDGYVALGCVIRGQTSHYDIVCDNAGRGIMFLGIRGLCIGNGILTVNHEVQATERADPGGKNKGGVAALAALHLIALKQNLKANRGYRIEE